MENKKIKVKPFKSFNRRTIKTTRNSTLKILITKWLNYPTPRHLIKRTNKGKNKFKQISNILKKNSLKNQNNKLNSSYKAPIKTIYSR